MKNQDNSLGHALVDWGLQGKREGLPTHSLFSFMASNIEHEHWAPEAEDLRGE